MNRIKQIAKDPRILQALSSLEIQQSDLVGLIIEIQQIPAPTFEEADRADCVEKRFSELGLLQIQHDRLHNVFAGLPGTDGDLSPPLVLSAHIDTVFPQNTDLTIQREGNVIYGPGIGDNATGVAGIIMLAKQIILHKLKHKSDIWFVANVGEEGLGNLQGMRAVVDRFGKKARYIVVEGGSFGQLMHRSIGVKRFRIMVEAPGGHSWGDFGKPSANHELGRIISELTELTVPQLPKTTFNVGVISGGSSINSIASSASLLLDLRSEHEPELEQLVSQVEKIVAYRQNVAKHRNQDIVIRVEQVGDRPAGSIKYSDPLVRLAEDALREVGWQKICNIAGSTDANIPISKNIPCVCIGLTTSGNSHRTDEYIELTHLPAGMKQLLLLTMAAADR